ncbi:MAG: M20 family metallopeptidase [Xanthomonadales bacterium]|nr:M20 family metallopeptidase [Xanthomonadales bacterium]
MDRALGHRIIDFLDDQRQDMLDLLEALVMAESPSSRPDTQWQVHRLLGNALKQEGLSATALEVDGKPHLYARPEQRTRGTPRQLLLGHYDTVWPVGTLKDMPFRVEGNTVRGPGTFDMKAGLVQIVLALRSLRALGLEPELTPLVFVNADEEIGSRSSTRYISWLARVCQRAFVMEPALGPDGSLKTARKGIGRFTVTVHGKAAHAGLDPDGGASAILELSHVIQQLFSLNDSERGVSVNVGTVDGGIQPNVVAPHSRAVVDVRVLTNEDGDRVTRAIHALRATTPGIELEIEGAIGRPAMETTPRNQLLMQRARDLAGLLEIDLDEATAGGGSDGNTTSQYTATLDGLGAVGDGAHAHHEFLYIDKTLERTALLALLILSPSLEPEEH